MKRFFILFMIMFSTHLFCDVEEVASNARLRRVYRCPYPVCLETFTNRDRFRLHVLSHTPHAPLRHCSGCDSDIVTVACLQNHRSLRRR